MNSVPLWLLGVVFVGGLGAITAGGALLLRRRVKAVGEGRYSDTAQTVLTYLVAVYALVLAFVIVNENEAFSQARSDVQTEALNVEDFYRATRGFREPAAGQLVATTRDYVRTVVDDEWDLLGEGESSATASAELGRMYGIMRGYDPAGPRESSLYSASLGYLHSTHDARHRRINRATTSLPPMLVAFLITGALAILAFSCLLGPGSQAAKAGGGARDLRQQLLVPLSLGCLLGFTLMLVLVLEHPYSGKYAVASTHFREGELADFFEPGR